MQLPDFIAFIVKIIQLLGSFAFLCGATFYIVGGHDFAGVVSYFICAVCFVFSGIVDVAASVLICYRGLGGSQRI